MSNPTRQKTDKKLGNPSPDIVSLGKFADSMTFLSSFEEVFSYILTFLKSCFQTSEVVLVQFSVKSQKIERQYQKAGMTGGLKQELLEHIPEELGLVRDAISSKAVEIAPFNKANAAFIHDTKDRYIRIAVPIYHEDRIMSCAHIICNQSIITDQNQLIYWLEVFRKMVELNAGRILTATFHDQFKSRVRKVINAKVTELEVALDQADKYNQSLKDFSYIVSHDLREPLRTINSYIKLLDRRYRDQFDDDARDFMHFITDGVERMDRLIQDLLKFSRIEHSVYQFEEVNLNEIMRSTCNSLHLKLEEAQGQVIYSILPTLIGSKAHLEILFQNIIDNAIKFRKPGINPVISIEFSESDKFWQISVEDNGQGMNLENKNNERIFKLFQRLQSFGSKIPGTGIGLAICKNIVLAHGGNIWVQSTPGKGTTIHFTLSKSLQAS